MELTSNPLPRLGAGWQYNAHDLGNGRVLKVPRSYAERLRLAFAVHRRDPHFSRDQADAWVTTGNTTLQRSYRLLEHVLPNIDGRLMGNPTLLSHGVYEQDRLIMVADYIKHRSFNENVEVIDLYIDATLALWRWGVSETEFNFTTNSGIDQNGSVVLCDLGELTAQRDIVRRMVTDRVWLQRWSYNALADKRLQDRIRTSLAERLTAATLDAVWNTLRHDREQ
jgi:hypothetical protein